MKSSEKVLQEQLENLAAKLEKKENEMRSIQHIGKALSSVLNREKLLILIMDEVTKLINAERGTLYIVDGEKGELWSKIAQKAEIKEIRLKIGVGIAGHVAKTGEIINIKDAYSDKRFDPSTDKKTGYVTRSMLCMPIREPVKEENQVGKIIAVLQVLNKKHGVFTDDDENLLASLGSQIAISLSNARLYSILEDRVNELNLLFKLETELSHADDLNKMLNNLLDLISDSLNSENGIMLVADENSTELQLRFAKNIEESKLKDAPFSIDKGIVGHVISSGKIYISNDAKVDKILDRRMTKHFNIDINNLICSPLFIGKKVIGIILLLNKKGDNSYFSTNDKNILESISSQIARGIDNYRLKAEKVKAERLTTIGNMMSTIVHDLRTPMNNIYGFVDLMLEEEDAETRKEYFDIIDDQIKILTNMTTDVLDFAKGKTTILPIKHPVDKLIKDFVKFFEAEINRKGFKLDWAINTASMIYVDPEKILRVFMNIMKNGLEAMKKGGTFGISADEVNGNIVFSLKDTGGGIPDEIKDKLFDSFVTSGKEGGTGLGLAIVKKVIDEHKGRIEVESKQGVGTTFKIYFPKK